MQNMLRPIIEAAGYRVVGDDDLAEVDLVIAAQGDEIVEEAATHTIWLRPEPDEVFGQEGRQHLPLRPRRAADRPEVRAGRGK